MNNQMNNQIEIAVTTAAHGGKSAISELIRQKLSEAGFKVTLIDDNGVGIVEEAPGVIRDSLTNRINALVDKQSEIIIRTTQFRRGNW